MSKQQKWDSILKEEDAFNPVSPESGYGWAKLTAEVLLSKITGMDVNILRLFNVYGPGEDYQPGSHAIPELARKVLDPDTKEIEVFGDGSQGRCFLYVTDAVEAYLKLLEHDVGNSPINMGNPQPVRINELVATMQDIAKTNKGIVYNVSKPTGVIGRSPDITKAKKMLGWMPKVSLDSGLRLTMDWIADQFPSSRRSESQVFATA